MIKVLAAELSDSGRLGRGEQLWAESAVVDLVLGPGTVTAAVQGSRRDPYVVTVEADPGDGMPRRDELWVQCTCPDDVGVGDRACKHVVATLFALSDEIAIEPDLLVRWRSGRHGVRRIVAAQQDSSEPGTPQDVADTVSARPEPRPDPVLAEIATLLGAPGGAGVPAFPEPEPLDHPPVADAQLAEVLADVLERLHIAWS